MYWIVSNAITCKYNIYLHRPCLNIHLTFTSYSSPLHSHLNPLCSHLNPPCSYTKPPPIYILPPFNIVHSSPPRLISKPSYIHILISPRFWKPPSHLPPWIRRNRRRATTAPPSRRSQFETMKNCRTSAWKLTFCPNVKMSPTLWECTTPSTTRTTCGLVVLLQPL